MSDRLSSLVVGQEVAVDGIWLWSKLWCQLLAIAFVLVDSNSRQSWFTAVLDSSDVGSAHIEEIEGQNVNYAS